MVLCGCFFVPSRRRHTRGSRDWSSDVFSSDLQLLGIKLARQRPQPRAGSAAENDWSEHGRSKEAAASRLNQRLAATDRMVGEAKAAHHGRIVEIAPVENDRRLEDLLQALEIGAPKLLPLGDDGDRNRALRG